MSRIWLGWLALALAAALVGLLGLREDRLSVGVVGLACAAVLLGCAAVVRRP